MGGGRSCTIGNTGEGVFNVGFNLESFIDVPDIFNYDANYVLNVKNT